jgi:hypothetical protein
MNLSANKQKTWDTLRGITEPTLVDFANKFPEKLAKYMLIQQALREPHAMFQPVRAWRDGPGGKADKYEDGVDSLVKFMPLRRKTIAKAMAEIEAKVGEKVYWGKMTWVYKYVYTRYGRDVVLGADVLIEGVAHNAGTVNYYYDNSSSAEGAHRWVIINGVKETI